MGWFALAGILGALLYWVCRAYAPHTPRARANLALLGAIALVSGFVLWAMLSEQSLRPARIVDAMGHGQAARFLLGLAVGFIIAGALSTGAIEGLNYLWLTLGVMALAVVAPSLDNWLAHVRSLKAAAFEI